MHKTRAILLCAVASLLACSVARADDTNAYRPVAHVKAGADNVDFGYTGHAAFGTKEACDAYRVGDPQFLRDTEALTAAASKTDPNAIVTVDCQPVTSDAQ